jgi:four helix bundle protein
MGERMINDIKVNENESQFGKEEKVYNINERLFIFSERILEIADLLSEQKVYNNICEQLVKSGTSIAANMEEADGAITKRDFINKVTIARKEAKETKYWLRLISEKYLVKNELKDDIQEISELIKILSAIIINSRKSQKINSII